MYFRSARCISSTSEIGGRKYGPSIVSLCLYPDVPISLTVVSGASLDGAAHVLIRPSQLASEDTAILDWFGRYPSAPAN